MPGPRVGAAYGHCVGLTGIIYGGIVCLWLCYLVPLALRRHDEAARARSVDRFSSAMRVLGGDKPGPTRSRPTPPMPAPNRRAARLAAGRRRRVLGLLVFVLLAVAGAAVAELVPVWAPAAPAALVVAFLVTARAQVRRARTASWELSLRAAAARDAVGDEPDDAPTVVFETPPAPPAPAPVPVTVRVPAPAPAVAEPSPQVVTSAVVTSDGSPLWDPLPVTLPTYVSKPRAERSIRTIDLGGPGTWTSGHLPDGEQPAGTGVSAPGSEQHAAAAPRAVGD